MLAGGEVGDLQSEAHAAEPTGVRGRAVPGVTSRCGVGARRAPPRPARPGTGAASAARAAAAAASATRRSPLTAARRTVTTSGSTRPRRRVAGQQLLGLGPALQHHRGRPGDDVEDRGRRRRRGASRRRRRRPRSRSTLSARTSPWTSVGPSHGVGPARLQLGQRGRGARGAQGSSPGGASDRGQFGPAAEEVADVVGQRARATAAGLGVRSSCRAARAPTTASSSPSVPRMPRRAAVDGVEGQRHPVAVVVDVEQAREGAATRAARPTPPPPGGACPGDSGFSSAPTALTKMARSGPLEHGGRSRREPAAQVADGPGRRRHRRRPPTPAPPPGTSAQGRWTPAAGPVGCASRGGGPCGGERLVDALDQAARRLRAELDGDARAGPCATGRRSRC